jgi:hypothetical protein
MPITYNPKDAVRVWPEADYQAVLEKVEDKTSKEKLDGSGGNPMQVLTWTVYNDAGKTQTIQDYIVIPAALFKLRQLAIALGKRAEFDAGKFQADDQIGCNVMAHLTIEENPGFDDKNKIGKLLPMPTAPGRSAPSRGAAPSIAAEMKQRAGAKFPTDPIPDNDGMKPDDIPF